MQSLDIGSRTSHKKMFLFLSLIPTQPAKNEPPTFLCTSLSIRYSAERSRQTFRLGRILMELKMSGEKLDPQTRWEEVQKVSYISTTTTIPLN